MWCACDHRAWSKSEETNAGEIWHVWITTMRYMCVWCMIVHVFRTVWFYSHSSFQTQPVPNPLSYYLHQTPELMHKAETLGNHMIELIIPFFIFLPRPFRLICGVLQILFQVSLSLSLSPPLYTTQLQLALSSVLFFHHGNIPLTVPRSF